MPPPRWIEPDVAQHCISRLVDKKFRIDDEARAFYLSLVERAWRGTDWILLGYALMSTHVHWVVIAGRSPLATFFQSLHAPFARWLNRREGRLGPVFADRPRCDSSDGDGIAGILAYVHNNPVRAKVIDSAGGNDWTSHNAYIGRAVAPPWLDVARGLEAAGLPATAGGRQRFDELVQSRAAETRRESLSAASALRLRRMVRRALGAPVEIAIASQPPEITVLGRPGTPLLPRVRMPLVMVANAAANQVGVSLPSMQSADRHRNIVAALRLALLCWRTLGCPVVEMATFLRMSKTAASRMLRRHELVAELQPVAEDLCARLIRAWRDGGER
jgi:hypothetical protein